MPPKNRKRSRHGMPPSENPPAPMEMTAVETELHREPPAPSSHLLHDLIKSSLEYLPKNQQLMAREVNQEWSRAVADVIESRFGEDGTRTLKHGEWRPLKKQELRSVLCCVADMTETFNASIRKIRFLWGLASDPFGKERKGLECMPMLEELLLRQTNLRSIAPLLACKCLKKLDLASCEKLTDDGILGLEQILTLEELVLYDTKVTTVAHLSACKALKKLDLEWCQKLADAGIHGLELIPALEELILGHTNVTTVAHLSACKALKKLNLEFCRQLTDAGILAWNRSRPWRS
jgi:Leucine-rich repeat (LRR) protein